MESTRSAVCYQADGSNTRLRVMPYCAGRKLHTRPKGVITYQSSFVGLDKKLSNPIGLLNFLRRVDKKDANYIYAFSVLFKSANSNVQQNQSSFFSSLHPNHRGMQESLGAVQYDRGHRNYPQNDDLG